MKLLSLLSITIVLLSCRNNYPTAETVTANNALAQVRAFSFVNSDSVKYYDSILAIHTNKAIPLQNGIQKYADGLYFITLGLHNKALVNFNDAVADFIKVKNDSFLAYSYLAIGNCNKMNGKEEEAVGNYLKALTVFEKQKNQRYISVCNANIAETYQQKNDIYNTAKYLETAKKGEPYGSKIYISLLHFEANLMGMTNKFDSAILIDYAGIAMAKNNNYPDKLSPFYDNLARCFVEQKKYDSAEYYYKKCINTDSSNGRLQLMADTYAQMVNLYGYKKEKEKMMAAAKYAFSLCDSTQYLRGKLAIFEGLNNYYTNVGQWEKLSVVKDSLQSINKRLLNEATIAKTAEYNIEYETNKKLELITKQQYELKQARILTGFACLVAILLCIVAITLYKNYKTKRSIAVNAAIQQQKDANVHAVFESEQTERIRIARDLHDSIGQKLSVLKMYLHNRANDAEKTPALIDETIQEVRDISHNLLPEELNFGFINAVKSDIEKLNVTRHFKINTVIEEGNYQKMSLLASLNVLRVFRELLGNLVKHSKASEIFIHVNIIKNDFHLQIKDDGIGISKHAVEESKGIGWKNIFARINMLKGIIQIEKNETAGSIIQIIIPIG